MDLFGRYIFNNFSWEQSLATLIINCIARFFLNKGFKGYTDHIVFDVLAWIIFSKGFYKLILLPSAIRLG